MTRGRGLPEQTGSTFPTKPFQHQRAHILGADPIATQPARAQLGQRRPPEQNIFLIVYAASNSCTGLSGKRKSGPKTGTYSIPSGDWSNTTLVGPKLHTKIIRSSQTFVGFAIRMRIFMSRISCRTHLYDSEGFVNSDKASFVSCITAVAS